MFFFHFFINQKFSLVIAFKETDRQKIQLELENRALRDKVCICCLIHLLFHLYFQLKH